MQTNLNVSSNSSVLICVFNNAKDSRYISSDFTRLNSKILFVNTNIFDLFDLVNNNANYSNLGLSKLNVRFIVHPDTRSKFVKNATPPGFKPISINVLTYEEFFAKFVGEHQSFNKKKFFLNSLSDSIFIFEDTSWLVLTLKFRYSYYVLSGGSNTKKHFLNSLDYRLSQFILATYTMNEIDVFSKIRAGLQDLGNQINPMTALFKVAKSINQQNLKIVFKSYNTEILDPSETKQLLDLITFNRIPGFIRNTKFHIVREYPFYELYAYDSAGDLVQIVLTL